uniref:C-type lectin n=1 Tax=Phalotris mertensi TaxID=1260334 RepID=A0A182C5Y9_9SAUR
MGRFIFLTLSLLVVTVSLNGIGADHPCPTDWSPFEHFCYKFFKEQKTWDEAERFCVQEQNGSHLASIQSWAESAYVARLVLIHVPTSNNRLVSRKDSCVYIGLNDPEKNGTWEWIDGSNFGYTSWETLQPNNRDDKQYCVVLTKRSKYLGWNNVNCESKRFFICKLQPESAGSP